MSLSQVISIIKPKSVVTENFRTLKANIHLSIMNSNEKIIMVTSTGPKEGKSTVVANVAALMANTGKKILILDCDLRNSGIGKLLGITSKEGLSNYLIGEKTIEDITTITEKENLYFIPAGDYLNNSSELLESSRFSDLILQLKLNYDYIFIDTPSLILTGDTLLISTFADACILVVAKGEIHRSTIVTEKELLQKINTNIIGVVFNKTEFDTKGIKRSILKKYYE